MNGAFSGSAESADVVVEDSLPQQEVRPTPPVEEAEQPEQVLTSEEIRALRDVASETRRGARIPLRLEQEFEAHERRSARITRVCLGMIPVLSFGSAPFWQTLVAGSPAELIPLLLWIELAVITPLFIAVTLTQFRKVESSLAELMLMGGFLLIVACVELIRYRGHELGHTVEPYLLVTIPVAVVTLARLPLNRCIAFIAGYVAMLFAAWLVLPGSPGRGVQEWILEILLLGTALLTAVGTRLSSRRQWAAGKLLSMMAFRDPLTGLANRRALEDRYEVARRAVSRGEQRGLFFALLDMDHFKKINDLYGHEYGDGVLAELGLVLAQYARRSMDMAARLGGDEFALLLYDCDLDDGRARLTELLEAIRNLGIEHRANRAAVVTVSAGGVAVGPALPLSDAYHAADHCLYKAKHAGRDGLVVEDIAAKAARGGGQYGSNYGS
ncbi:GGDEF domain-containing protein [Solimonas sp. K1W22B-7]|uniref:GGDEF domain-containing protein n=1 Tax=Solimonas sp. K1W22B-7 TaxID=2303331 RepID=UPI000E332EE8|nr:GGDEF domain-containing protein [Solimonas sp. K1W22B-7]AXQ30148.1 GGDEF domain-containing protein [Solimonas sp. K1W22B-7]